MTQYTYRLYDAKSGELVAEGSPTELVAAGWYADRDRLRDEYMRQKKHPVKKPRTVRIEREKRGPADTKIQMRKVWVYTARDADGKLMAQGTAAQLVEAGVLGTVQEAANWGQKGRCPKRGIARLTREKEVRPVVSPNRWGVHAARAAEPGKRKKREKRGIPGVKDPDALQLEVHRLCGYNAAAAKRGLKEMSYGVWAAAGKPDTPQR